MKKTIQSFEEFKRVVFRTKNVVCCTNYGFYYRTKKCSFFYSCRALVDRMQVFRFLYDNQIRCCKAEELLSL